MAFVAILTNTFQPVLDRILVSTCSAEIVPVCAVVGGYLAQDILKTLSAKDAPILNHYIYSGMEGKRS